MPSPSQALLALCALLACATAAAADPAFTGTWTIDLRTRTEKAQKVECGNASFSLVQTGDRITGDHSLYLAGCGRINDGGDGTVTGVVVGTTAVLVVTSGRNGAIAIGTAKRQGSSLRWRLLEEIKAGEPAGDASLILGDSVLSRTGK